MDEKDYITRYDRTRRGERGMSMDKCEKCMSDAPLLMHEMYKK